MSLIGKTKVVKNSEHIFFDVYSSLVKDAL